MLKYFTVALLLATPLAAQDVANAPGGVLRALDKISGKSHDISVSVAQPVELGALRIVMKECRYPSGNPAGNAYANIEISEAGKSGTVFSGWMIASSPALSSMEHPRYDVWVIRCTTS